MRTREALPTDWAATQHNLGSTYWARVRGDRAENLEAAINCYQAALQVYTREALPTDWATTQHNLGSAYADRIRGDRAENLETAIDCFQTALQVRTREALPADWTMTQNNLGNAYVNRVRGDRAKNLEAAINCFRTVLRVGTREAPPTYWAATQNNLGSAYVDRVRGDRAKNLEAAIGCYRAALEVYQADSRPNDSRLIAGNLGRVCSQVGRWGDAAGAYRIALDAAEILYQASLLVSSRQAVLTESAGVAGMAAYALARAGEVAGAVVVLERGRARELGDALERDRAELAEAAGRDPEAYEIYRRAGERLRELEAAERRSTATGETILAGAGGVTAQATYRARRAVEEQWADQTQAAVAELRAAAQRIRQIPGFETFLDQPGVDTVAAAVEVGTPVAYLVCTPAGSVTLLAHRASGGDVVVEAIWTEGFTASDLNAVLVASSDNEITNEITDGYLSGVLGDQLRLDRALTEALPLLGQRLTGPLAARLAELGATGVVLVPCGLLGLLPLHAASYHHDDTPRCLLEEVDVSYTPSARVLTTARHALRATNNEAPVVAGVGNPLPHPQPLAFARAELEEVVACFPHARPLYEQAATKEALAEAAVGASYVHLSCHGRYDPAQPLSSQLHLAGQQPLTLGEILAERPFADARLVVASACQTAITDFNHLPDEAIGLPAGFLSAGTPGVVGTLWPVDDLSTALLMAQFYGYHLHGDPTTGHGPMAPVQALRRAQRWLATVSAGELHERLRLVADPGFQAAALPEAAVARLSVKVATMGAARFGLADDPNTRPFAPPYHWAPFIFVGA